MNCARVPALRSARPRSARLGETLSPSTVCHHLNDLSNMFEVTGHGATAGERVVYRLPHPAPDGMTALSLTPLEFLKRLAKLLPPLKDPTDVEFATKLRAAMRRNVNRGRADAASWCSALAAELVLRRVSIRTSRCKRQTYS